MTFAPRQVSRLLWLGITATEHVLLPMNIYHPWCSVRIPVRLYFEHLPPQFSVVGSPRNTTRYINGLSCHLSSVSYRPSLGR